ncbi:MAG: MFS transporter [Clostridia bacterium]|nr:MFS transporter [Clostridia bacterium]
MIWIKKNYHWVIAAIALLQLFFHSGAGNNFTNLHLIPVSEHLGISRGDFSVAYSTKNLMAMLLTFVSGAIISRFGYRKVAGGGMLLAAISYLLLAFCLNSYPLLFLYCGMIGVTNALCSTSAVTLIISDWFHKHKGLVLGLVSAATGLGGSVLCMVQSAAMEAFSWRASFVVCAIGVSIGSVLIFLFIRNKPEEKGLLPLGEGEEVLAKKKRIGQEAHEGLSMAQLFCRPSFYLMILLTLFSSLCIYMLFLVVVPHLRDQGLKATETAMVNSYLMLALAFFKFVTGFLVDKIGAKKVQLICMALSGLGLTLFSFTKSVALAFVSATVFAAALPIVTLLVPLLAFSLFGYKAQPQYTGIFMGMISGASMIGSILANYLFDALGSYNPGLLVSATVSILLIPLYLLLYRLCEKDRKREENKA